MELQISCSVCTKVQEASILQRKKADNRRNIKATVCKKEREYSGSRDMPGPYTYAVGDTAEAERIEFYGVFEGEKQFNDI